MKRLFVFFLIILTGCTASKTDLVREAIAQHIPTPSTLKIIDCRLVEQSGSRLDYSVTVDSQNLHGAIVRTSWTVVLRTSDMRSIKTEQTAGPKLDAP